MGAVSPRPHAGRVPPLVPSPEEPSTGRTDGSSRAPCRTRLQRPVTRVWCGGGHGLTSTSMVDGQRLRLLDELAGQQGQHVGHRLPAGARRRRLAQADAERRVDRVDVRDVGRLRLVDVVHRQVEGAPQDGERPAVLLQPQQTAGFQSLQCRHLLEAVGVHHLTPVMVQHAPFQTTVIPQRPTSFSLHIAAEVSFH